MKGIEHTCLDLVKLFPANPFNLVPKMSYEGFWLNKHVSAEKQTQVEGPLYVYIVQKEYFLITQPSFDDDSKMKADLATN